MSALIAALVRKVLPWAALAAGAAVSLFAWGGARERQGRRDAAAEARLQIEESQRHAVEQARRAVDRVGRDPAERDRVRRRFTRPGG